MNATNAAFTGEGDAVDITAANKVLDQFEALYAVGDAGIATLKVYSDEDCTTEVAGLTLVITDTTGTLTAAATGIGVATLPADNTVYFQILGCTYTWTVTTA